MKQRDLVCQYIATYGGWVRAVEMKGRPFKDQLLGSESDKRCYEIMDEIEEKGYYECLGKRYVIEAGKQGKFKTYRLVSETPAPKEKEFIVGTGWL